MCEAIDILREIVFSREGHTINDEHFNHIPDEVMDKAIAFIEEA